VKVTFNLWPVLEERNSQGPIRASRRARLGDFAKAVGSDLEGYVDQVVAVMLGAQLGDLDDLALGEMFAQGLESSGGNMLVPRGFLHVGQRGALPVGVERAGPVFQ
jgi:hypothetical protein